jgi:hypothetical protein
MGRGVAVTAADAPGEALTAALIQISSHAERIAGLDTREASHYQEIAARLREVTDLARTAAARADGSTADQAAIATSLDGLDRQIAALATRIAVLASADDEEAPGGQRYRAVPAPRWWNLAGPERATAVGRLRGWVDQVYRPSYGQLAALLPGCWEEHPLCLYTLDWLSELWSVLYLGADRRDTILAAQAEWQTRLLPAVADQMAAEASGCPHQGGPRRGGRRPDYPQD